MNTYFGLITVYNNGLLPDNSFSRIHGLNFIGAGVSVIIPASTYNGISTATIGINFVDANSVIGGIADVKSLVVSPGVSTVSFLSATNGYFSDSVSANEFLGKFNCSDAFFSGIVTTAKLNTNELIVTTGITSIANLTGTNAIFSGIITASAVKFDEVNFTNASFGIVTSTEFKGSLISPSVNTQNLNVSPGQTVIADLTGTNAFYSGILTANHINTTHLNLNSLNVSNGITTVGVLSGTNSYFNNLTANTINATTLKGNLTNSALVGNIDITQASFIGDFNSLFTTIGLLSPTRRIFYVDGQVIRANSDDSGAASNIPLKIWTDIWDNADVHQIDKTGWTRGTEPNSNTTAYTTGTKLCYNNVNQAFNNINGRVPTDNSTIIIWLYGESSSNEGLPSNTTALNSHLGIVSIIIEKGPSQPKLTVGITTYCWGQEHCTGQFYVPNGILIFRGVNVNCSGTLSNRDRRANLFYHIYTSRLVLDKPSRFKFYSNYDYGDGHMFVGPSPQDFVLSGSQSSECTIYWESNPSLYQQYGSNQNTHEFIYNLEQPNNSLTPQVKLVLFKFSTITIWTRRGNPINDYWPPVNFNVEAVFNLRPQSSYQVFNLFFAGNMYWVLEGVNADNQYYGGLNLNLNVSGSNFNKLNILTTDSYQSIKIIQFYGEAALHTSLIPGSLNLLRNKIEVNLNTGINMNGTGLICNPLYSVTLSNSNNSLNLFRQFSSELQATGISSEKYAWKLGPGCVLDGVFSGISTSFS